MYPHRKGERGEGRKDYLARKQWYHLQEVGTFADPKDEREFDGKHHQVLGFMLSVLCPIDARDLHALVRLGIGFRIESCLADLAS